MTNRQNCDKYKEMLNQLVDDEISQDDKKELQAHLENCEDCQQDLKQLQKWKGVSSNMKNQLLPDMAWDEYWNHLYNRLERGIGWIFISIGAIILLGLGIYEFIMTLMRSTELSSLEKVGILSLAIGFVILLISLIREKIMVRKHDKYKEIIR